MSDLCNVLMIYPKFNANSFWNYQKTCEMIGAKYPGGPLGLITVAAMLPPSWSIRLVNCNTEPLHDADFAWADMVMTGGMLVQQWDTLAIIDRAHALGKPVVVGRGSVAAPMTQLIEDCAIPVAMVGMLYALPNTQLTRRLTREGRLFLPEQSTDDGVARGDQCTAGLNFVVKRPRRDIVDDYRRVLRAAFTPEAFFGRVLRVSEALRFPGRPLAVTWDGAWRKSARFRRLMSGVMRHRPDMRWEVVKLIGRLLWRNPRALTSAMRMTALYVHLGPFSRYVVGELDGQIQALDDGRWVQRPLVPVPDEAAPAALVA